MDRTTRLQSSSVESSLSTSDKNQTTPDTKSEVERRRPITARLQALARKNLENIIKYPKNALQSSREFFAACAKALKTGNSWEICAVGLTFAFLVADIAPIVTAAMSIILAAKHLKKTRKLLLSNSIQAAIFEAFKAPLSALILRVAKKGSTVLFEQKNLRSRLMNKPLQESLSLAIITLVRSIVPERKYQNIGEINYVKRLLRIKEKDVPKDGKDIKVSRDAESILKTVADVTDSPEVDRKLEKAFKEVDELRIK